MNKHTLLGNWNVAKGKVKEAWGKLTDDDLDQIKGHYDQLLGTLQKRYGYTKEETKRRVDEFLEKMH